jgi:hypothetical protein
MIDKRLFVKIYFEVATLNDILVLIIDRREKFMRSDGVVNFGCRFDVSEKRPAMMHLREWHGVNIGTLASRAGVEPSVIYCMLLVRPVQRCEAIQVLEGFSRLVGVSYALDDVDMVLLEG